MAAGKSDGSAGEITFLEGTSIPALVGVGGGQRTGEPGRLREELLRRP